MYLIDTNIFLEVLLGRRRKKECKRFLREIRDGKLRAFFTDFSVHSIIVIMSSFNRLDGLKKFLRSLRGYKGLSVYNTSLGDEVRAIENCKKLNLSVEDSIQYTVARKLGVTAIISYDKHFDGLDIPRLEPSNVVKGKEF